MAIQESTREDTFLAGGEDRSARDDRVDASEESPDAAAQPSDDVDAEQEMEFEEILLPGSLHDGVAQVGEAVRNLVRIRPLGALLAAAGVAYLAGRFAARR